MMLAIDTAGPWVAVCGGTAPGQLVARSVHARLNHNELLPEMVAAVGAELGTEVFSRVAVDVGPGSFTGTRVGVAFAAGLAQGWQVQLEPCSSFEVALDLAPRDAARVAVALPIVRDAWCRAVLRRGDDGWMEETLVELSRAQVLDSGFGGPVIVPWGDLPDVLSPPPDWNPARALWRTVYGANLDRRIDPGHIRVRYVGPSQAERNFHARKPRR